MKSHLPYQGKFVDTCFIMGGGLPYTILYGEEPWDCGVILSLSRAVGNKSTQEPSVSKICLESLSLSVPLVPSTIPELWGLYAVCNFHLMFKVFLPCYTKSATKARPLSDPMTVSSVQFSRSVVSDSLRPHELAARQASLSITNSRSSLRLTSIE